MLDMQIPHLDMIVSIQKVFASPGLGDHEFRKISADGNCGIRAKRQIFLIESGLSDLFYHKIMRLYTISGKLRKNRLHQIAYVARVARGDDIPVSDRRFVHIIRSGIFQIVDDSLITGRALPF